MDAVSEIKARLPIEELVGSYCQLQRKGRTLKALCPFHNDTHPSLTVSPDKGIAYCFVCQSGGDIFSFYQKIENVDFREALKDLAEKAGVTLPKERVHEGVKRDEKERLRACLEAAASFYQTKLREDEHAREYLRERGVTDELTSTFRLGFAPDSFDATYTHLLKGGFSRKEILSAGLGVQKELTEERIYDRFRNRIMFPIEDQKGAIIGFGGRLLEGKDASTELSASAKYINSPDGPLYSKSNALFGLSRALDVIRKRRCVILVEGYFDVLAIHRLGIGNVVAQCGTALTEQHAHILKRSAERVCLCLDADAAGAQAAARAFLVLAKHDLDVRTLLLPAGKDPDECARITPEEMKERCSSMGIPYLDAVLTDVKQQNLGKREILHQLLPLMNALPSAVLREEYIAKLAHLLGTTPTAVQDDLRRVQHPDAPVLRERELTVQSSFSSMELLCGLLLTYPMHAAMIEHVIEPDEEGERSLFAAFTGAHSQRAIRITDLPKQCQEHAKILQLYCEEHFGTWSEGMALKELRKLTKKVNWDLLRRKQEQLLIGLKQARNLGKKIEEEHLLIQYQRVLKLSKLAS